MYIYFYSTVQSFINDLVSTDIQSTDGTLQVINLPKASDSFTVTHSKLFVRKCYTDLIVKMMLKSVPMCFCNFVHGPKGIGKSFFMLYVLWKLFKGYLTTEDSCCIAFQFKSCKPSLITPLYAYYNSSGKITVQQVQPELKLKWYINDAVSSENMDGYLSRLSVVHECIVAHLTECSVLL